VSYVLRPRSFAKRGFAAADHPLQCCRMTTRVDRMADLLRQHFRPEMLEIVDDSARHAGHAGAAPGGETHYTVLVVAAAFHGQTRLERSRSVHAVLNSEFATGLHALTLTLQTPEEQAQAASPRPAGGD
jgi:BolA protein